jgi:hypothetical protein
LKYTGTLDLDACSVAEMDGRRGVEAEAGMAMLVVVPAEETLAESAGILDGAEPSRELRPVLERLELRF